MNLIRVILLLLILVCVNTFAQSQSTVVISISNCSNVNLFTVSQPLIFCTADNRLYFWNGSAWQIYSGGAGGYTLSVQALTSSPADGQTVHFGQLPKAPITTANVSKVFIRKAGTIKTANIYCYSGTAGTAENWQLFIRKNNTTDTLIAAVAAATNERIL